MEVPPNLHSDLKRNGNLSLNSCSELIYAYGYVSQALSEIDYEDVFTLDYLSPKAKRPVIFHLG